MSDRNTTVVTDGGGSGVAIGIVIAVLLVLGFTVLAFGWPFALGSGQSGPTINIKTPAAPAAQPAAPAPAK
jgi:hypothetical protein